MAGNKNPLPQGFHSKAQWRYFFVNPKLKKWSHLVAHKTQAHRGGKKIAYRSLPQHSSLAGKLGIGSGVKGALRKNKR